jgi:hypothetical protein
MQYSSMHASGVETGGMEPESDVKGGKRLCFPYTVASSVLK